MTTTPKDIRNNLLGQKLVDNLKKRHFEAFFCPTAQEAVEKVSALIPDNSSVTWGGSMTIRDMGLTRLLHQRSLRILDRDEAQDRSEAQQIYREAFSCDYYLTSANAISEDGVIVNIDGNGNRVAALIYGPDKIVMIVGMNKLVSTVEDAVNRVSDIAAPANGVRLNKQTPCATTGFCHDCLSPECMCSHTVITRRCYTPDRIHVILVGEALGY